MKKSFLFLFTLSTFSVNLFGYSLSGTAATSVTNLLAGDSSFVIVDTTGGDTLDSNFFTAGTTITAETSVGDYYIAAHNAVVGGGFGLSVSGNANFNLEDGSTEGGDYFYVVAFGTNTGDSVTLSVGDTFGILAGSNWNLGSNNSAVESYGSQFQQFPNVDGAQFSVVPEPSAFAALAGLLSLACVMLRRRA